jgi:hypothetical protein
MVYLQDNLMATERKTGANKVLPKAGLNNFLSTEVQGSTFVLRLNFCTKNPRLRQYPKRYMPF